mmetsp:Transcript_31421/g.56979  ORF Transcript_31421/g.56979 Transcript_31421/m.56979 type:complete len:90 (+) Transcript_31421:2185-2454(+)
MHEVAATDTKEIGLEHLQNSSYSIYHTALRCSLELHWSKSRFPRQSIFVVADCRNRNQCLAGCHIYMFVVPPLLPCKSNGKSQKVIHQN